MVLIAILLFVALALTVVAWKMRAPTASVFLLAALVAMVGTITENLSRPKPLVWERRFDVPQTEALWWRLDEGRAIYMVMLLPEEPEPRFYVLPWSKKLAEDLNALRERQEKGSRVILTWPFEPSLEHRKPLVLHELPPPALPRKAGDVAPPAPRTEEM